MIGAMLFASLAVAGAQHGCADGWSVEINPGSFANNGSGKTFSATQLEAFREKVDAGLRLAINEACGRGVINPATARKIREVEVSTASGASDPFLYSGSDGTLTFEWIFAEEDLAVPSEKDIVAGAACWADPNGKACNSPGE